MTKRSGIAFSTFLALSLCVATFAPGRLQAQTATGSIIGTVTDPSGAVVPSVNITMKSVSSGFTQTRSTTSTGTYSATAVEPGEYLISFQAQGFRTGQKKIQVRVGETANGDFTLQLGSETTTVTVESTSIAQVNTVQAIVQDVMTSQQIESLPLNGRNFLDLAQMNPGVQIQDGGNFDPTKNGFTGISVQGRSGRSTRIELDGIDISDETVGTTTINISEDSIQEFQVAQSSLDPATSLTSTGSVNIFSKPGTNAIHGSGFSHFRSNHWAARVGQTDAPFDREQYGGTVGGPFKKDKLFWFLNAERTIQDGTTFTNPPGQFSAFAGAFPTPYHESMAMGKLDWNVTNNWRAHYQFRHNQLNGVTGFGGNVLMPFANRNLTDLHIAGLDGTTGGRLTHSFRFGYMRFRNGIVDARSQVTGLPAPFPGGEPAGIGIGGDPICLFGVNDICLGPNFLAPQFTLQRNLEFRYDGSYLVRSHTLRYGVRYVRIPEAVYANFVGLGPIMDSNDTQSEVDFANNNDSFGGGASNPLNYPLQIITFGNGLGWFSELPGLGHTHGATNARRFAFYVGDTWKVKPNLTVNLALRYDRDTGRTNSDKPGLSVLEPILPGAGQPVHQPNLNFAPQLSFAWDPFKNGKTSIRAGIGLFYDNIIFNTTLFDRTLKIPAGISNVVFVTTGGELPGTGIDVTPLFGQPIGSVVDQVVAAQTAYQAASLAASQSFNPNGTPGFADPNVFDFNSFTGLMDPNYHTPYSTQLNVGVQHEFGRGLFFEVNYLHNTNVHGPMSHDINLVGASNLLDMAAAQAAIAATLAEYNATTVDGAIANGADIFDFSNNGLGSPASGLQGTFVPPQSGFAFSGRDTNFGQVGTISMIGRSNYNALQFRLRQNLNNPFRGVRRMFWMANWNLSRFNSTSSDQDFYRSATDNLNYLKWYGPNNLDRTRMITFATTIDFPAGWRVSWLSRFNSALPATLTVPFACQCPAEIFLTDFTGDGTGSDVLPGTNLGAFGRSVKVGDLNNAISKYNSSVAGTLTPASQALVSAGLFTADQLVALGAVAPSVPQAPSGQVGLDSFVAGDFRVSWRLRPSRFWNFRESLIIEPTMDIFNLFNIANYDPPNGLTTHTLSGALDGTPGSVNGTTQADRTNRYGLGSGVFSVGLPRSFQFGVRVTF